MEDIQPGKEIEYIQLGKKMEDSISRITLTKQTIQIVTTTEDSQTTSETITFCCLLNIFCCGSLRQKSQIWGVPKTTMLLLSCMWLYI